MKYYLKEILKIVGGLSLFCLLALSPYIIENVPALNLANSVISNIALLFIIGVILVGSVAYLISGEWLKVPARIFDDIKQDRQSLAIAMYIVGMLVALLLFRN